MTISSFEDMQATASESFDASKLEAAREYADQATLSRALEGRKDI